MPFWGKKKSKLKASEIDKAIKLNDEAFLILNSGRLEESLLMLEESASYGMPNALASLMWTKIELNDLAGAKASFETYYHLTENFKNALGQPSPQNIMPYLVEEQRENCIANLILASYLMGENQLTASLISEQLIQKNLEIKFINSRILQIPLKDVGLKIADKRELLKIYRLAVKACNEYLTEGKTTSGNSEDHKFLKFSKKAVADLENLEFKKLPDFIDSTFVTENGMTVGSKANAIIKFTRHESGNEKYEEFFAYNTLGIPLAVALNEQLVELTPEGLDTFEDTWTSLCQTLGLSVDSPDINFERLFNSLDGSNEFYSKIRNTRLENLESEESFLETLNSAEIISLETKEWLRKNAIDLNQLKVFSNEKYIFQSKALFNVEVAEMFVSNFYPIECDDCDDQKVCNSCGKNPNTYLTCMTANKDSDFLLIGIKTSPNSPFIGTIVKFYDHALSSQPTSEGSLSLNLPKVAPVRLGKIEIDQFGGLFFGDKSAVANSADFIASLLVEGSQEVVAWIGLDEQNELTPLALSTANASFANDFFSDVNLMNNPPEEVVKCISDSLSGLVQARIGSNPDAVAEFNAKTADMNSTIPIGFAWFSQLEINDSMEEFMTRFTDSVTESQSISQALFMLDMIRLRGQTQAVSVLLDLLENNFGSLFTPSLREFALVLRNSPPGKYTEDVHYQLLNQ